MASPRRHGAVGHQGGGPRDGCFMLPWLLLDQDAAGKQESGHRPCTENQNLLRHAVSRMGRRFIHTVQCADCALHRRGSVSRSILRELAIFRNMQRRRPVERLESRRAHAIAGRLRPPLARCTDLRGRL
jgi:hypothetical protein